MRPMDELLSAITKYQLQRIINLIACPNQVIQLAILAAFFTFCAVVLLYKGNGSSKIRLPPSPPKLPIIGHLHLLKSSTHQVLHDLSMKYGPIMLLRLGRCPTVVVCSAEAAKDVMKTYDAECASRPPWQGIKTLSYNRLDVAFSPYGDYSREVKKFFSLELMGKRAHLLATAKEREVDRLMETIAKSDSRPIMLDDLFYRLMDGIIGTGALGRTYGADHFKGHEFRDIFNDVTNVLGSRSAEDLFPSAAIGRLIDKINGVTTLRTKTFQKLDTFFEQIIDRHSDPAWKVEPGQEDLVDVLLRNLGEQLCSVELTRDHVKAILFDTFIGGIDTTTLTLLWAFAEIIRSPRVMEKLQNEIRSTVGNNKARVKTEDLENFPYLKMVIKEAMRLHPVATLLVPRITTAPIMIGKYSVPPDTLICVNVWAIGRDPSMWENPEEFYPERFEDGQVDFRGSHFQFTPFGAGRRMCPGYPLGIATTELTLANLLYRFNWELPHGMTVNDLSMEETGALTFSKKTPLELIPIIYNPQARFQYW